MTYVDLSSNRDIKGRYSELKRAAEAIMGRQVALEKKGQDASSADKSELPRS